MERKPLRKEIKLLIFLVVLILAIVAVGRFNLQVRSALSLLSFETPEKRREPYSYSYIGTVVAKGENILVIVDDHDRAISFDIDELTVFQDPIRPGDWVDVWTITNLGDVEPYPARGVRKLKSP